MVAGWFVHQSQSDESDFIKGHWGVNPAAVEVCNGMSRNFIKC